MENLKKLRKRNALSQQKLADILHVSQQSIYKYENNITTPDIETLKRMADYFDTSVDYIIDYSNTSHKIEPVTETMLNENETILIQNYRKLTKSQKNILQLTANEFLHLPKN